MKKQTLTKKQQKALLDIAKRLMVEVENRGDLEARGCDSEDFIEVPVWGIQKAMEEAEENIQEALDGAISKQEHDRQKHEAALQAYKDATDK